MSVPPAGVLSARRLSAFAFAFVLAAQPVILCCSAHAASTSGARHHDGAAHHDGRARHHGDASRDVPPASTVSATCATDVAQAPALRERTREATPITALAGSQAGLRLHAQPRGENDGPALTPSMLGTSRHATPLRL